MVSEELTPVIGGLLPLGCEVDEGDDVDPREGHGLGSMCAPRGLTGSQSKERPWWWPSPMRTPPKSGPSKPSIQTTVNGTAKKEQLLNLYLVSFNNNKQ